MGKEQGLDVGFIINLSVLFLLAVVAIIFIVFGNIQLKYGGIPLVYSIVGGACAGMLMYSVVFFSLRLKSFSRISNNLSKNVKVIGLSWPKIITISIFAGVAEELLFRGVLQTWIATHTNIYVGVLISSVIFSLAHPSSVSYIALTFFIGLLIGAAYAVSESIEFVIVWHIISDIIGLGIFVKFPHLTKSGASVT